MNLLGAPIDLWGARRKYLAELKARQCWRVATTTRRVALEKP